MDKLTDKLCDLIVKCAKGINAVLPAMLGIIAAYFIVLLVFAIIQM